METIEQKQKKIGKKIDEAKQNIEKRTKKKGATVATTQAKEATTDEQKPKKKEQKPLDIEQYISQGETTTSGAKLVTWLMCRENGSSIEEMVQRATELGSWKMSSWGHSRGSIKSHISYLKARLVDVRETNKEKEIYKIIL